MNHLLAFLSPAGPCFPEALRSGDLVERHVFMQLSVERVRAADRPLRILEIGSWLGFSALTWAESLGRRPQKGSLLCVDPWIPYHTAEDARSLDFPARMNAALHADVPYHVFLHNIRHAAAGVRVDHVRGRGGDVLPYLRDEAFDIVYVDGSHYYEDVVLDLHEALRITRSGGIICGDDLERQIGPSDAARGIDGVSEEEALRDDGTDTKLLPGDRFYHPGVTRAVAEVLGRVPCWNGFWAVGRSDAGPCELELEAGSPFVPRHFAAHEARRFLAIGAAWSRPRAPAAEAPAGGAPPPGL